MQHGIRLKSIRLKKVGVYEELNLQDLDNEGFVTISGLNKDSQNLKDNRNGVGKSLMFGSIPNLLYEADPLAMTKKAKTNMLGNKESEIELTWGAPDGKDITVLQTAKKYQVTHDGEDQKVDRQDVARGWIEKHFPLNREEFYSYAYITTQVPHPFQRATPSERLQYLTNVFNLDVYDRIRAKLKEKLDAARDAETESKGLADMLDVTQRKQNAIKISPKDRKRLKKMIARCDTLKEQRNEMYQSFVELSTVRNNAKQYEATLAKIEQLGVESDDSRTELKLLRVQLQQFADYADYAEELEEYKETRTELESRITELGLSESVDTKKLAKRHGALIKEEEQIEQDLEDLDEQGQAYDSYKGRLQELADELAKRKKPKRTREEAEEERAEARAVIKAYHRLHEHLDDGTTCPTCSQDVDIKSLGKAKVRAEKTVADCDHDIIYHVFSAELEELQADPVERPQHSKKQLKKSLDKVRAKIEQIETDFEQAKKFDKLTTKLESLRRPKKVKKPEGSRKQVKQRIKDLESLRELEQTLKAFKRPETSFKSIDKQYAAADAAMKELTSAIAERETKVQNLKSKLQEFDHHQETLDSLNAKLEKLLPLIEKRKLFEILYKGYSNTSLKLKAVEGRLKQIENKLNEYSPLVFPEPMHFTLTTSKQGVLALVTRVTAGQTTDISIMSGAESNCFRLLYAIAIMPFIPQARRTNFIVLDEPESHCSESVIDHMRENFLPILKQIVPNIFWITPLDDGFSENRWTVTKEKGISTLDKVSV